MATTSPQSENVSSSISELAIISGSDSSAEEAALRPRRGLEQAGAVVKKWRKFRGVYMERRNLVENRWFRLELNKRKKLLTTLWRALSGGKEMPQAHRPDVDDADAIKWPLFNQADLANRPEVLLTILDHRARFHPGAFQREDLFGENYPLAKAVGVLPLQRDQVTEYREGIVMADLTGVALEDNDQDMQEEDDSYGTINEPESLEELKLFNSSDMILKEAGDVVMEVQYRIYSLLDDVVENITGDKRNKPVVPHASDKEPLDWRVRQPTDPEDPSYEKELTNYFNVSRTLLSCTAPGEMDWDYVIALSARRRKWHERQIAVLKEDPGALLDRLQQARTHGRFGSQLKTKQGTTHPYNDGNTQADTDLQMWTLYFQDILAHHNELVDVWAGTGQMLEDLRTIPPGTRAWMSKIKTLAGLTSPGKEVLGLLLDVLVSAPDLREYFRTAASRNEQGEWVVPIVDGLPGAPRILKRDSNTIGALAAWRRAMSEERARKAFGLHTMAEELRQILSRFRKNVFSEYVLGQADSFYDLTIVAKAANKLWESSLMLYGRDGQDGTGAAKGECAQLLWVLEAHPGMPLRDEIDAYFKPQPAVAFDYPPLEDRMSDRAKKDRIPRRIKAEQNLANFWAAVEKTFTTGLLVAPYTFLTLRRARPNVTPPFEPAVARNKRAREESPGPRTPSPPAKRIRTTSPRSPVSPIRAALPGEGGPRRPAIDRRAAAAAAAAAAEEEEKARAATAQALATPPEEPVPAREHPPIQLRRDHYEFLEALMVPPRERAAENVLFTTIFENCENPRHRIHGSRWLNRNVASRWLRSRTHGFGQEDEENKKGIQALIWLDLGEICYGTRR
ncbi:hypothetical protein M406DRAFT_326256 [Cryphonectria parasitica EP155]|uniref:Uncharacterized protein n=1 Tax=Cryphonectria parasitica (strain ATCC 38755 / EP155) TaxID=660469 RepID=A0A9P5CTY7_CRYP1|nr:uncharacterized protein M406DRAFT_326256 [Cryphonectria parasitica EP155]KAF3770838.1 hypothetical protein M406DRAFT_326256 [Cryphonectria parasitica EP155]